MKAVSGLRYSAAGVLGQGLVGSLFLTVRIQTMGEEYLRPFRDAGTPVIFVFWHGRLLPLVHVHRGQGAVVLVSEHGDGEYVTRILRRLGFGTVRGSSTRGGVRGLKGLIRAARGGHDLAVTPDGPRGPNREFKPGAVTVARMTGLPLIPIGVGGSAGWRADSWDRFLVPRPFSTVRVAYGPPCMVGRDAGEQEVVDTVRKLSRTLADLSVRAGDRVES